MSLDLLASNPAAHAWAGASIAPAGGRQARPDLSRDKSGKKQAGHGFGRTGFPPEAVLMVRRATEFN